MKCKKSDSPETLTIQKTKNNGNWAKIYFDVLAKNIPKG